MNLAKRIRRQAELGNTDDEIASLLGVPRELVVQVLDTNPDEPFQRKKKDEFGQEPLF
ncbi:hypothetical protein [Bifidobacterium pseudocatenulatum]|uniref:hypothetical protein n=1 Tax=Bifidobacterium pseudocatenulatum TaxID=28026 RepID=UPI0015F68D0F|nr:hypothetical protein [Bifidobacterium pseudocatenulatum]